MSTYGPFYRGGEPGGPGCAVGILPVQGKTPDGTVVEASLLDAGPESSEIELLRTTAAGLGIRWGNDDFGWWASVPRSPVSRFAGSETELQAISRFALFREDDNGARFLIAHFASREAAQHRASELAYGGHKQHYFIESVTDRDDFQS